MQGDWLTLRQVADDVCGGQVTIFSVRRWIAQGIGQPRIKLPATRLAGTYRVRREDAEEFLKAASDPGLYKRRRADERTERAKRRLIAAGA